MLHVRCPHCGHRLNIDEKFAGQTGSCNKCGNSISVPALAQPVAAPIHNVDSESSAFDEYYKAEADAPPRGGVVERFNSLNDTQKGCVGCLAILFVPFVLIVIMLSNAARHDAQRMERINAAMRSEPDFRVSMVAILLETAQNEYAADQKYDDKVVEILGTVGSVTMSQLNHIVYLGNGQGGQPHIRCDFDEKWNSRLAQLRKGQTVTIRGVASIWLGGTVYLDRCELK